MFAGLLPLSWQNTHTEPLQHANWTPISWAKKLSKWFTKQGWEAWTHRNTTLYNKDKTKPTIQQILDKKITQLYNLKNELNIHD